MSYQQQPSTIDFLKLIGLLVVIGAIAFDIFSVRKKNKMLWSSLETQKAEFQSKLKALEDENTSREKGHERKMADSEKRIEDAKCKSKDNQSELIEEIKTLKEEHRKAMEEQKTSFEKCIQEMKEDFSRQKEQWKEEIISRRVLAQTDKTDSIDMQKRDDSSQKKKKSYRCSKCSGKGEIQVKKRCEHCGGSGKIQETHKRWVDRGNYYYNGYYGRGKEKISTVFQDCPHCLPGAMRGSGSKGYTIEKEKCPKCNGKGMIEL